MINFLSGGSFAQPAGGLVCPCILRVSSLCAYSSCLKWTFLSPSVRPVVVGWSVCHNFPTEREVSLPCSYRATCFLCLQHRDMSSTNICDSASVLTNILDSIVCMFITIMYIHTNIKAWIFKKQNRLLLNANVFCVWCYRDRTKWGMEWGKKA